MDLFLSQLSVLCRRDVTRNKWVFVPSHAIGRTLGERIALEGTNWLNLRFVTPLDVALRMGAPFLVERGIDPSEEGLGPALIMRLLLELPASALAGFGAAGPSGYFRPLAVQPTMAQALWTTVRELRMAGVRSSDLKPEAFESAAKHVELRALLAAYERFLETNRRGDMATVYEEAVKHPDWCPIQPEDRWTEMPDVIWAPLQRRLIDAMPGERIAPRALELPGVIVPRRLEDQKVERLAADPSRSPLAFLMAPGEAARVPTADEVLAAVRVGPVAGQPHPFSAPSALVTGEAPARRAGRPRPAPPTRPSASLVENRPGAAIDLFHAGGREAEIEEVLRRLLATGAPLDQVEIACASEVHLALVWEKALRHEWPVTIGPGIPAAATRPGRALIGFCDWIETDFSAGHLRHLLQSGDMGLQKDDEGFTAGQAARTIARAEAGWGRETYGKTLAGLRKSYEARANDPDLPDDEREAATGKAALTERVARWITGLIASIPEPAAGGTVPLQSIVESALAFVERTTARSSQLDHRAGAALGDHVSELRALGAFLCPLGEALRFIRERVQTLQVAPERPRPGHLYACTLLQAGHSGRPHLYVVGLEEGRVFPSSAEDPVLLDCERAAISPALRLSRDRIDESVYGVLARLAPWSAGATDDCRTPDDGPRIPATCTFSYSCRDSREFRETHASWLMLQAFRLPQGDASLSYQQMKSALGEPVSTVPVVRDAASSDAGWWLRSVVSTGDEGVRAIESTFAGLAAGRRAEAHRDSDRFTEYDGLVSEAGPVLDPSADGRVLSVTDLESAASCPFRFFLKRGLGLRPVDERERDRDVWLDPSTRGHELHAIYAAALRRARDAGRRLDVKQDGPWLLNLVRGRLDELKHEMPPARDEIFDRESADFLADVELFLEAEAESSSSTPIAFEVSFGRPLNESAPLCGSEREPSPDGRTTAARTARPRGSGAGRGAPASDRAGVWGGAPPVDEPLARAEPIEIDLGSGLRFRIAGRIDRIDRVGPAEFHVIDYKTGGFFRNDYKGVFRGGRRLQHALYGLAAAELLRARYGKAKVTAGEYYFPSHRGRRERVRIKAPTAAETARVLADLRELIVNGAFVHTPDRKNDCRFCDYTAACGSAADRQASVKLGDPKLQVYGRLGSHE